MSEKTPRNSIQKCPLRGDILQDVQPKKLTRWLPEERTALKGLQERRQMFLLLGEFSGGQIVNVFAPNNYGWNTKNHVIHPEWWVNYYTTPQLQLHYHYNYNYNHNYNITTSTTSTPLQLQLRTTTALHHTTSRSCEWGDHCNHCNHSKKHNSNHLLVHQWIRSAIHASQQLTSPIAFYPWNFRHRLVRYYW